MFKLRYFLPLLWSISSPCVADIYGYVDENGAAHTSSVRVDNRYYLFKKNPAPALEPAAIVVSEEPRSKLENLSIAAPAAGRHYAGLIAKVALEQEMDAALIHAVVAVESGYDARALSPKGAVGLMQLMPATAQRFGVTDVWDPLQNLRGGTRFLRHLLARFDDDLTLALAAYNAGEGAVILAGRKIPSFAETQTYVPRVLQRWKVYRGL